MKLVEKFKSGIKENKKFIIVMIVLWFILTIVLVAPLASSITEATTPKGFNTMKFLEGFIDNLISFTSITKVFSQPYIGNFFSSFLFFTIFYVLCTMIGMARSKARGKYYDIEHGSSDWCDKGEQYRILSRDKGIILAEENYLPVDKRGNVNTLIVGRIWIW